MRSKRERIEEEVVVDSADVNRAYEAAVRRGKGRAEVKVTDGQVEETEEILKTYKPE